MRILKLGVFLILFLSSCKYHCPEVPDSELIYVPYNLNDTIKYSNNNDTIEFIVIDYYKTKKHTAKTGLPVMDLWCEEQANYKTGKNSLIDCYIREMYDAYELFKVEFNDNDTFNFSLHDTSQFGNGIISQEYDSQKDINGRTYHNCFTLTKNEQSNLIWKIIKVDSFGIVEFYHQDYAEPWKLIN